MLQFRKHFEGLVKKHNIHVALRTERLPAQRIAALCSEEVIRLQGEKGATIGIDAECAFLEWALSKKLHCDELTSRERRGKRFVKSPFGQSYYRIFENLDFSYYFAMAEEVLFPKRKPITRRQPVCEL